MPPELSTAPFLRQTQNQRQAQEQALALTPELLQRIHLLEISTEELRQEITRELEKNPLLEESPQDVPETPSPEDLAAAEDLIAQNAGRDTAADAAAGDFDDATADAATLPSEKIRRDNDETDDAFDAARHAEDDAALAALADAAADFREDHAHDPLAGTAAAGDDTAAERRQAALENASALACRPSLDAFLRRQAREETANDAVLDALDTLAGELDDNGFMSTDISHLCLTTNHARADLDAAWKLLKTLDPPGIGATNLRECLLLQLYRRRQQGTLAALIVDECFPLLLKREFSKIAQALETTVADVKAALPLIATLSTAPARDYESDAGEALVPDVRAIVGPDGRWTAELVTEHIPRLRINPDYRDMLAGGTLTPDAREYITTGISKGQFFIKALRDRQQTLKRVADTLIAHQTEFLDAGPDYLRPLKRCALAEELGLDETTVGRVVNNKNLATPHGVFSMSRFFGSGYETAGGGMLPLNVILRTLRELIENEPPTAPLGDAALAKQLERRHGIKIARRTIAKYRDELGIPVARDRAEK